MIRFLVAVPALVLALAVPALAGQGKCHAGAAGGGTGKVAVCHRPPGNPTLARTLLVGRAAVQAHLAHGDALGSCPAPCRPDGDACAADGQCCSGLCEDGACTAPCAVERDACETGADCCSGICTDTTRTCAEQCTVGPELHGPACSRDLDCCAGQGVCILGLCYPENLGCAMPGQACNPDEGQFCCFDDACVDGACVAQ